MGCLFSLEYVLMVIRKAKISDAKIINSLVSRYAELDRMLFRPISDIYEKILTFLVAEIDGEVVGCGAISVISRNLAEVKSLAVSADVKGNGVGKAIVKEVVSIAGDLGIENVFALTLETDFFLKCGFNVIEKDQLPMKVWSDCASCPKQAQCDETAVIISTKA